MVPNLKLKLPNRVFGAILLGTVAGLVSFMAGCGSGGSKTTADALHAFDSAPAAAKQLWDKALAAEKAKDYLTAEDSLNNLRKMELTSQQKQAADAEFFAFHDRLYQAAEKGDSAAVKAIQQINVRRKR